MIKAVIFDLDGLMIDSERMTYKYTKKECEKRGYVLELDFYKTLLGVPRKTSENRMKAQFGQDFPMQEIYDDVYTKMAYKMEAEGVPKKPGLDTLLTYLKKKNYKMIVATSSDRSRVDDILKWGELTSYFHGSVCGNEVKKGKPHPEVFLRCLEKLNVKPEEAVVLEDSEAGIDAAAAAGIKVICIPDMKYPDDAHKVKATHIVESLYEAQELIEQNKV